MHVLLFGSSGEIRELSADAQNDSVGLLKFLQKGFDGGTDFETPLNRAPNEAFHLATSGEIRCAIPQTSCGASAT